MIVVNKDGNSVEKRQVSFNKESKVDKQAFQVVFEPFFQIPPFAIQLQTIYNKKRNHKETTILFNSI